MTTDRHSVSGIAAACIAVALWAIPAAAQDGDAAAALAEMQALTETGTFGADLPAAALTAEGCILTMETEADSPQLGTVIVSHAETDARTLNPPAFGPDEREDRTTIWILQEGSDPVPLTLTIATEDATIRDTFGGALGTECPVTGDCSVTQTSDRFPVVFYFENGMDRAREFSTALSRFQSLCEGT